MGSALTAAALGVPEAFNAAEYFVDRHIQEGRGARVAIECGDERVTYADLFERVNRFGSALRGALDVRPEERVALLLLDTPAFTISFFGAIKAGAVPIPINTLWKAADYAHVLRDSSRRRRRRQPGTPAGAREDSSIRCAGAPARRRRRQRGRVRRAVAARILVV